jgi:hypothetical protein
VRFAVELAKRGGIGAREAALAAGYSEVTARATAWNFLRKPHVRALVEKHLRLEAAVVEVTEPRVILQAAQWVFLSDAEAKARGIRITSAMRCKGLEILARATGLLSGDQHDHKHLHLPGSMGVQFILPVNDRVPVDPAMVIDEGGNGRDRDPAAVPPGAVLELPPLLDEPEEEPRGSGRNRRCVSTKTIVLTLTLPLPGQTLGTCPGQCIVSRGNAVFGARRSI